MKNINIILASLQEKLEVYSQSFSWDDLEKAKKIHVAIFRYREHQQVIDRANNSYFGFTWHSRAKYEYRQKRKEERRNKHIYSPWFMQTSLGADYGEFRCDRCHTRFYHSPSSIRLGAEQKYHCICGNCTNEIIYKDWNSKPYH